MPEVWIQKGSEKTVEGNLLILIPPLLKLSFITNK